MIVASISTASAVPSPTSLMKMISEVTKAPIAIAEQQRRRGDDPAGALEPDRDRLASRDAPPSRASLIRDEQEHAVVGREPEGDREQQQRLGRLEPALARVAEQALEPAVLEDQDEDPERRR